jgi:hypothetical protein
LDRYSVRQHVQNAHRIPGVFLIADPSRCELMGLFRVCSCLIPARLCAGGLQPPLTTFFRIRLYAQPASVCQGISPCDCSTQFHRRQHSMQPEDLISRVVFRGGPPSASVRFIVVTWQVADGVPVPRPATRMEFTDVGFQLTFEGCGGGL